MMVMKKLLIILTFILGSFVTNAQSFGQKVKCGKFIKDGKTYIADDKFMKQFNAYGSSLDPSISGYFADIRDVLMRGETVIYDSQKNELSPNVKFRNLNERQDKRMMSNRSKIGMFFDALFNTKVQNVASAISSLRYFHP